MNTKTLFLFWGFTLGLNVACLMVAIDPPKTEYQLAPVEKFSLCECSETCPNTIKVIR